MKAEVLQLLEDEKRMKNLKFNDVFNLIENNKNLQNELITQQFESQKALLKALINKEIAERVAGDEDL
jgi:hypothetical protein